MKKKLILPCIVSLIVASSCVIPLIGFLGAANPLTAMLTDVFITTIGKSIKNVMTKEGEKLYEEIPENVKVYTDPIVKIRTRYLDLEKKLNDLSSLESFQEQQNLLEEKSLKLLEAKTDEEKSKLQSEISGLNTTLNKQKQEIVELEQQRNELLTKEIRLKRNFENARLKNQKLLNDTRSSKDKIVNRLNSEVDILKSPIEFQSPDLKESLDKKYANRLATLEVPDPENYKTQYIDGKINSVEEEMEKINWEKLLDSATKSKNKIKEGWDTEIKPFKANISDNLISDLPLMSQYPELSNNFEKEVQRKFLSEANTYKISVSRNIP